MNALKSRLEDSLNPNKEQRKGDFFKILVEAFSKDEIKLVEETYVGMTKRLLPDRMYQLAEKDLKEKLDIYSCLKLKDHCKKDATILFKSTISEEELERMAKRLFEGQMYHNLRKFSDNYSELARPIIKKLMDSYAQKGK